jgi:hypothetical protein
MYQLLVRLMLLSALLQLGISVSDFSKCRSRHCLKIDWRPISVFPEEAKRFRRE